MKICLELFLYSWCEAKREKIVYFVSVNLTNSAFFSIKGIDIFANVCYTENKLENKTNILTNKNKNKQEQKHGDTKNYQL